jgi:hypothetical protein
MGPGGAPGQWGPPGAQQPWGPPGGGTDQWAQGGWPPQGDGGPRGGGRFPRPRGPLVPAIGAAVLIVVVAALIVAFRGGGGGGNTANSTTAPTTAASAAPTPQSDSAERAAAAQLVGLLSQSGSDRGDVVSAYVNVQGCKALPQDAAVFSRAESNRRVLLDKLASLPGRSALPPALLQALTGAWQASAQDDTDLAKWATDERNGCKKGKTGNDPNLKASFVPDSNATMGKEQFTKLWNPLARKYGLPTYKVSQL